MDGWTLNTIISVLSLNINNPTKLPLWVAYMLTFLTFRRHTEVGHDNHHWVGLDPEDIAGHVFIIQWFCRGDDACPVVHLKMTWKQTSGVYEKEEKLHTYNTVNRFTGEFYRFKFLATKWWYDQNYMTYFFTQLTTRTLEVHVDKQLLTEGSFYISLLFLADWPESASHLCSSLPTSMKSDAQFQVHQYCPLWLYIDF